MCPPTRGYAPGGLNGYRDSLNNRKRQYMSEEELPAWLNDIIEDDDSENVPSPTKKKKRVKQTQAPTPSSRTSSFSAVEMAILGLLVLLLCFVVAGFGGVVYLKKDQLLGVDSTAVGADISPTATPAIETTPTDTPEPTLTPTSMLPQAQTTAKPSPTATYAVAPEFINKDKISSIIKFTVDWRELSLPEDIPISFLTRRQLKEQWQDDSFDAAALATIQTQQEFYRALGLIEPEVDLVEATFNSQTDLIMGYYTPTEKIMYIISESVNMFAAEEMTLAHEYVHALQDYHFDLNTLYQADASADTLLAARSLPEGDARALESLFIYQNISQEQIDYTIYRYLFQDHPTIEGVSPALGIFTFFPYTAGEYFVFYLMIEGGFTWDLVNDAYSHPPVSSEQVMHPEKYLAGEMPTPITIPDLAPALGADWRNIDQDVLGEIGFLVWLIDQVDDETAINGAAGWEGDTYTLWVNDNNQRALAESSLWETDADATEFAEGFSQYMALRESQANVYQEARTHFWEYNEGVTDVTGVTGVTSLTQNGRRVLIIVGPDKQTVDAIKLQFTNF